jgi:hypothetical protein
VCKARARGPANACAAQATPASTAIALCALWGAFSRGLVLRFDKGGFGVRSTLLFRSCSRLTGTAASAARALFRAPACAAAAGVARSATPPSVRRAATRSVCMCVCVLGLGAIVMHLHVTDHCQGSRELHDTQHLRLLVRLQRHRTLHQCVPLLCDQASSVCVFSGMGGGVGGI